MRWNEARLQRLFRYYNTRYWKGRLPEYRVVPKRLGRGTLGLIEREVKTIFVNVRIHSRYPDADRRIKQTLIHEMAHAGSNGTHAGLFFDELLKLAGRGCQLAGDEILYCTEGVTNERLNGLLDEYRREIATRERLNRLLERGYRRKRRNH